jgi:hypothetical protein
MRVQTFLLRKESNLVANLESGNAKASIRKVKKKVSKFLFVTKSFCLLNFYHRSVLVLWDTSSDDAI